MTTDEMIRSMYGDMSQMKNDMSQMQNNMSQMKNDISQLGDRMSQVESGLAQTQKEVQGIKMTLENVTNKNIQIIAEGHLDLSRKLDDALRVEHEKELYMIRVNKLEDDVRKLQEQVTSIA